MENPRAAKKEFLKALLENPGDDIARYNLAISNLASEQVKDALKEVEALEKAYEADSRFEMSDRLFNVYFAKAFILGFIQDVPGALGAYQKALRIKPASLKVKNNIEVLTAQSSGGKGGGESDPDKKGKKSKGEGDEESSDGDQKDKSKGSNEGDKEDIKGQDDESLKKKNLSKEELEQILKEIKDQESKVRSKENKKNTDKKGGPGSEKTW